MNELSTRIRETGKLRQNSNKSLVSRLKRNPPHNLDEQVHRLHEAVFGRTDCLQCANCCKTTSPVFTPKDIERIARYLRMKPGRFTEQYLKLDEDNDYVLKQAPCPFLENDNRCAIYEERPAACRTYPHTDRKRVYQLLDLTYRNSFICPAVQDILKQLDAILS